MPQVSLTGATLLPQDSLSSHHHHGHSAAAAAADPLAANNDNDTALATTDSPLHPHLEMTATVVKKPCCDAHHSNNNGDVMVHPTLSLKIPAGQLVQECSESEILAVLWPIVRLGSFELLQEIVTAWNEHLTPPRSAESILQTALDTNQQHSFLHWATKRVDDVRFVRYFLVNVHCSVTRPSENDSARMTPLHWTATLPSLHALVILNILLTDAPASVLETIDSTGCTPLLIATQQDQVETVAYLVQRGADLHVMDQSRDSAWHWAAYKGSLNVLGLLSYYAKQRNTNVYWTMPDAYGQMPLHLAALRGHAAACKLILQLASPQDVATVLRHKDANGRTPLDLAIHKSKPAVAAILQQAVHQLDKHRRYNYWTAVQQTAKKFVSSHEWKVWLGLVPDTDESPQFPHYYVWAHIWINIVYQFTVFWPLQHVAAGVLWDKPAWFNCVIMAMTTQALRQTARSNPGQLNAQHAHIQHWKRLYETTLESLAHDDTPSQNKYTLCHSCHIARPPRAKHDRFTGCCIEVFDHHCPFVANTVGLYNYRWFLLFLVGLVVYFVSFWYLLVLYWIRSNIKPWWTASLGVVLGIHVLFPAGMLFYHVQLVWVNLTTNEHLNRHKYPYLWDSQGRYRNPFDQGIIQNLTSRLLFPGTDSYRLPNDNKNDSMQAQLLSGQQDGVV